MKLKDRLSEIQKSWYFLLSVIVINIVLFVFNKKLGIKSVELFGQIILKMIFMFVLVFVLMSISNYFITPKFIIKHLKEKKIRKWIFVIVGGILSSGPIYMWYPLLADLKDKGLSYGLIACFLYNRAIKIPLIPIMILYFSWQYILVLLVVMIFISIIQGILLNKLMEVKK